MFVWVSAGGAESPIQLVYVPSHLYHILFELLKNAMRAVVEHYPDTSDFPAIQLLVVNGQEDLTIKVSRCPYRDRTPARQVCQVATSA